MGFSIGKVFKPIEEEMKKYAVVDSLYMPEKGYGIMSILRNIRYTTNWLKCNKYDVVHITGTEHYLLPFLRHQKVVVTVHDLGSIYNKKFSWFKQKLKALLFINPLKLADKLVFISEKSKKEACELINLNDERLHVIPDAVDETYQANEKVFNTSCPRLLHIGTKVNKNIPRIAQALNGMKCELRIIGKLNQEQITALDNNHITYSSAYGLPDAQIYDEYKACDIVCFPSTYEGFGMPIIEGQSVGRVVVTSDLPPMNEVAGDGAVLVDPYDIVSIRNGFEEAVLNHDKYITKGLENASKYKVKDVAIQYMKVYNLIVNP